MITEGQSENGMRNIIIPEAAAAAAAAAPVDAALAAAAAAPAGCIVKPVKHGREFQTMSRGTL